MNFKDDYMECCWCGEEVAAYDQSYYYVWRGEDYCSMDCIAKCWREENPDEVSETDDGYFLFHGIECDEEELRDEIEKFLGDAITVKKLLTAEDHDSIHGDFLYDMWKDEQLIKEAT